MTSLFRAAPFLLTLGFAGFPFAVLGAENAGPPRVFVSVAPQLGLVRAVAGELVHVETMVEAGHSPHTYAPSPAKLTRLSGAVLYFSIGLPLEAGWLTRLRSLNPGLAVADMLRYVPRRSLEGHGHEDHGREEGALDPHVWLSPRRCAIMAHTIEQALARLLPEKAALFAAGRRALVSRAMALDQELLELTSNLQDRTLAVYHPAFGYFAEDYGLHQLAVELEGKLPTPRQLTGVLQQLRRAGTKVLLVQPEFDQRIAETLARQGGVRVVPCSPLGEDPLTTAKTLATLLVPSSPAGR